MNARSAAQRAKGKESPKYKFAGSKFERAKHGSKGEGQDARSNPSLSAILSKQLDTTRHYRRSGFSREWRYPKHRAV